MIEGAGQCRAAKTFAKLVHPDLDSIAVSVFVDFLSLTNTIRNKYKTNLMFRPSDMSTLDRLKQSLDAKTMNY